MFVNCSTINTKPLSFRSSPPQPNLLFRWQFNNSLESMLELPPYSNIEAESHHQLALAETEHGSHGDSSSSSSHPHHHHHSSQSSPSGSTGSNHNLLVGPNLEEMVRRKLERQQQPPKPVPVDGQLYMYRIESFTSFGTVTCTATNTYGQSGHCLYHILVAGEFTIQRSMGLFVCPLASGAGRAIELNSTQHLRDCGLCYCCWV